MQATAQALWRALRTAPGPDERPTGAQRVTLATFLKPHRRARSPQAAPQCLHHTPSEHVPHGREALEAVVGSVDEKSLLDALGSVAKLRVRVSACPSLPCKQLS